MFCQDWQFYRSKAPDSDYIPKLAGIDWTETRAEYIGRKINFAPRAVEAADRTGCSALSFASISIVSSEYID